MAYKTKREDILFKYLEEAHAPFTLSQFFKATGLKKSKKNEVEIRELIEGTEYFIYHKRKFFPRSTFMDKIPLRIAVTRFELSRNILIPGHRLLPFHPFGFPMDAVTFTYKGKQIPTRKKSFKMEELQIFFSLMDLPKIPIHNIEAILDEGADLEITVLDMTQFYKENNFDEEDSIVVRAENYKEGIFAIEFESLDDYHTNIFLIEKKDRDFWKALKTVLDTKIHFPNVEKQLLHTYFALKDEDWEIPGSALGPLLGKNKDIAFSTLPNGRTMFHYPGQEYETLDAYPNFENYEFDEEEVDFTSVDGILQYLNNNNDGVVVRALLLDMITEDERFSYSKVEDYLFSGLNSPFMPDELRDLFKFLVHQEFLSLKKNFNPEYAFFPITTARKRILDELLKISQFLRLLDSSRVQLEDLPKNEMMHLMELDRALVEVLHNLETSQMQEKNSSQEVHRILKMVDRMSTELPNMFDVIHSKLK